jgi:putative methyltransferase (TIGR04325 family)
MKNLIKQFIPPILIKLIKNSNQSTHIYKNYEEANAICQDKGYSNRNLVKIIIEKNIIFKNSLNQSKVLFDLGTLRTMIALGLSKKNENLNVIDFGGGGGYHYAIASKALGENSTNLKWHIVETTEMVKEAQRISTDSLKFYDDISGAAKDFQIIDLVFTSSALQYCPNPLLSLEKLTELNSKYLFITRTPFVESSRSLVCIQNSNLSANGPGPLPKGFNDRRIKYPITYASRKSIENILTKKYEIQFMTEEGEGIFGLGKEKISMNGYFCVRKI